MGQFPVAGNTLVRQGLIRGTTWCRLTFQVVEELLCSRADDAPLVSSFYVRVSVKATCQERRGADVPLTQLHCWWSLGGLIGPQCPSIEGKLLKTKNEKTR